VEDTLVVSATVTNTGERSGEEIAQLYVQDLVGSVTRPVRELKGFQRISLGPGESVTARFEVPVSSLGFYGDDLTYQVEPGAFRVWVGPDAEARLNGEFVVAGA